MVKSILLVPFKSRCPQMVHIFSLCSFSGGVQYATFHSVMLLLYATQMASSLTSNVVEIRLFVQSLELGLEKYNIF